MALNTRGKVMVSMALQLKDKAWGSYPPQEKETQRKEEIRKYRFFVTSCKHTLNNYNYNYNNYHDVSWEWTENVITPLIKQ